MNDSSEVSYATHLLRSVIADVVKKIEPEDEKELMERVSRTLDLRGIAHVFAFCLSELPDIIPQWVAYAGRRGGFALY